MRRLFSLALGVLLAAALPVNAQSDYPNKAVRIMVGANAGGGTDIIARMLADKFAESLKQPFVVENRPGASNTIAADLTAKAPADGYALLVATNTGQAIAPHLLKLSFDPLKQLQPVGRMALDRAQLEPGVLLGKELGRPRHNGAQRRRVRGV